MSNWIRQEKIESADGLHNVEIYSEQKGCLFRFFEHSWKPAAAEELLFYPDGGYFSCTEMSGYYDSFEGCKIAALQCLSKVRPT